MTGICAVDETEDGARMIHIRSRTSSRYDGKRQRSEAAA